MGQLQRLYKYISANNHAINGSMQNILQTTFFKRYSIALNTDNKINSKKIYKYNTVYIELSRVIKNRTIVRAIQNISLAQPSWHLSDCTIHDKMVSVYAQFLGGVFFSFNLVSIYCGSVSNQTIIPLPSLGNEMIIPKLRRSASLAIYHLISNVLQCALLCPILKVKAKCFYFSHFSKPCNIKFVNY